jgi:hypothetical protein
VGKTVGLILGIAVIGFLVFLLSPLLILFGWNNIGNEVLGWPRLHIFQAILIWLTVWAVGATARGGSFRKD